MASQGALLILDGAYGEGGGVTVRTALTMAALTQQPFRITSVRGAQKRQGLNSEDLLLIRALAQSTHAEVIGAELGSMQFSFLPTRTPRALNERLDVGDDRKEDGHANAQVVLVTLLPVMARTGAYSALFAVGETFGRNVLGFDAYANVTLPALQAFGLHAYPDMSVAGFGLHSRGEVATEIEPSALVGVDLSQRGELLAVRASITTGELPEPVAERGEGHLANMARSAGIPLEADCCFPRSSTPGAHVTLWAEFERGFGSASAFGARGVRIETVAQQAFSGFMDWYRSDSTVDANLADQLIVTAAMAEGHTVMKVHRLSPRLLTMIWVIKQFLPIHITVKGAENQPGSITIRR